MESNPRLPFISIVVPVYNGGTVISECIESLLALEYPKEKSEIIIVDNNSTDDTGAIIHQFPVVALSESMPGSYAARNRGIMESQGEIIAFVDADCLVEHNWTQEIAKTFQDERVEAVMGFAHGINANIFAALEQKRWEESWFHKSADGHVTKKKKGLDTRNCALRKRTFNQHGLFNPAMQFCGDLELSIRLNRGHCNIVFNPDMKVWHKNPTSIRIVQEKGLKRLPFLLRLMRDLPKDLNWEDVPFPRSAFHGLSNLEMGACTLTCVLPILRSVRRLLLAMVQLGVRFNLAYPGMFKLYKIYLGMSYDMAILQAKRIQRWS